MPDKRTVKKAIKKIVTYHLKPIKAEIFIFGSQANLKHLKAADIDVGIKAARAIDLRKLMQIKSEFEEMETLHPIDLVDFSTVDKSFAETALSNIEKL